MNARTLCTCAVFTVICSVLRLNIIIYYWNDLSMREREREREGGGGREREREGGTGRERENDGYRCTIKPPQKWNFERVLLV